MSAKLAAVLGTGQTPHVRARKDVSIAGMVRQAAGGPWARAGLGWNGIGRAGPARPPAPPGGRQ